MTHSEFKKKRLLLGLTQGELAGLFDVGANTISRYETGTTEIPRIVELAFEQIELQLSKPKDFDLLSAISEFESPQVIIENWFKFEERSVPKDYGVVFFKGWETFSFEEKIDALRDAKRVLDRQMKIKPEF